MINVTTKAFMDGIAFYEDDKEIAFYSNMTKEITYNQDKFHFGCAGISYVKNIFMKD